MNRQKNFEELNNFLFRQAQDENQAVTSEADIETIRTYVNDLKSDRVKEEELDLHRFLPAMTNRLLLTTLESFKGLQSDILIAILPHHASFKIGNYTTILSSAKKLLFIINRNEEFHDFVEDELRKKRLRHTKHDGLLGM